AVVLAAASSGAGVFAIPVPVVVGAAVVVRGRATGSMMVVGVLWAAAVSVVATVGEDTVDGAVQLSHQKCAGQAVVDELDLLQRQTHPQKGVVTQLAGPVCPGTRGRERVPGVLLLVLLDVFDRVQQVSDTAEQTSCLSQRFGVGGTSCQNRGVCERLTGGFVVGSGHRQNVASRSCCVFALTLPGDHRGQFGTVQAEPGTCFRCAVLPVLGHPAGERTHTTAGVEAVPVLDVVTDLGGSKHQ